MRKLDKHGLTIDNTLIHKYKYKYKQCLNQLKELATLYQYKQIISTFETLININCEALFRSFISNALVRRMLPVSPLWVARQREVSHWVSDLSWISAAETVSSLGPRLWVSSCCPHLSLSVSLEVSPVREYQVTVFISDIRQQKLSSKSGARTGWLWSDRDSCALWIRDQSDQRQAMLSWQACEESGHWGWSSLSLTVIPAKPGKVTAGAGGESSLWWWRLHPRPVVRSLPFLQGVTMGSASRGRLVCPSPDTALPASVRGGRSQGGSKCNLTCNR